MSTITKEWLQQTIAEMEEHRDLFPGDLDDNHENVLAALRIALASLEAEPVAFVMADDLKDSSIISTPAYRDLGEAMERTVGDMVALYTAPPAPANAEPVAWLWSHRKHPSEVSLVRPEDDERAEGAHWSGWSCQALYAAPPATVSVPDEVNVLLNHLEDVLPDEAFNLIDVKTWNNVSMLSRPDVYRAAMLQGADGNSPEFPWGWVACSERMPDADGNYWGWWSESKQQGPVWFTKTDYYSYFQSSEITHWMPLPAAPQQEVKS